MNEHQIELFSSKKSDDWATPDWLYKQLDDEFHFDFDPCPLNSTFNGLEISWGKVNFVNPPYSKIKQFVNPSIRSLLENPATSFPAKVACMNIEMYNNWMSELQDTIHSRQVGQIERWMQRVFHRKGNKIYEALKG